jgi:acetyl-CoA carboxylase biotin carboxyl carrier protein
LEIKEIKAIIDLMKKNDLAVFKMEHEGFKLTLKTGGFIQVTGVAAAPVAAASAPAQTSAAPAAPALEPAEPSKEILSPMVGTFYRAASPESPAFSEVGQTVAAGDVVCIIEAMKVMNEIKSEIGGTIVEILVENGKTVQFGQALFRLK